LYNRTVVRTSRIENVIGKPVSDQNFFGRHTELKELQAITEREHVLLLAPRRVGKTSLLHALAKRVDRDGSAIGVYASVAAATNETQFVQAVLNAIVDVLSNDGYLVEHDGRWRFRSGLLRRYWVRHVA
jgi:ATP/maltotriose-dependent transcriptional regulator MalT